MNFYTLFTKTENVHLLKDVGMIPESLARNFSDVKSYIVTYKNGEYPYVGKEIQNTEMVFIKKRFGKYLDGMHFIRKYAKEIDVLNIYHLNLSAFFYCIYAKIFLKKSALVYLKLDAGPMEMDKLCKQDLRALVKRMTIRLADVVSGESSVLVKQLQEVDPKIKLIPNGYYAPEAHMAIFRKKADRIITVGRLGTAEKNTKLLIDAFVLSMDQHGWELRLIGSYTKELNDYIDRLCHTYTKLKDRLKLVGIITDKRILQKEYEESKIFALPSKLEGFPIVLPEALMTGNYIITSSHVPAAYDVIYNADAGRIAESDDALYWKDVLTETIKKEIDWRKLCEDGFRVAESKFNWDSIAEQLYGFLKQSAKTKKKSPVSKED